MNEQYYLHTASFFLALIDCGMVCFLDTCAQTLCQYAQVSCQGQGLGKQLAFPYHAITIDSLFICSLPLPQKIMAESQLCHLSTIRNEEYVET